MQISALNQCPVQCTKYYDHDIVCPKNYDLYQGFLGAFCFLCAKTSNLLENTIHDENNCLWNVFMVFCTSEISL